MVEPLEIELPRPLADATDALARDIAAADPVARFRRAQERFERDDDARSRVAKLAAVQARIRGRQAAGQVNAEDLAELRALRKAVEGDRVITDFWHARRDAVASLRSINEAISRLLGVDFATLARRPGPC
jgi:cell fate (sporulation/competence/biofilm development) regulator YlbF (YheA/YmcA/DUF963 family)